MEQFQSWLGLGIKKIMKLYGIRGHSITTCVDKIRKEGGPKKCQYLSTLRVKTVHAEGVGGSKNGKILST